MLNTQLRGLYSLTYKEILRCLRIWQQTLIPPIITMVLYFLIFGHVIGHRIGSMDNVPYLVFITPGLVMMPIIMTSFANVVSSFYSIKFSRSIEEILLSPMRPITIVSGFILGGMFRGLLVGLILMCTSLIFVHHSIAHPIFLILTAALSSMLFALLGLLNAIFANSFDDISIVPNFVLTPLIFLGGVFYSTNVLPVFWQYVSLFNPVLYIVDLFRYAWLNQTPHAVYWQLLALLLCNGVALIVNVVLIHKGTRIKP